MRKKERGEVWKKTIVDARDGYGLRATSSSCLFADRGLKGV
jgi:hypothetical protein